MNKKFIVILFCIILFSFLLNAEVKFQPNNEIPKKMIIISQSCTMSNLWISAVDLSNNELIIMVFYQGPTNSYLINVIRTGSIIDLSKQPFIKGEDSPNKPKNN